MDQNELEDKLEKLSTPQLPPLPDQWQLKLSILSAKKSAKAAIWLLLAPFLILGSALMQSLLSVSIPPWSWMQEYSPHWPLWVRFGIYVTVIMIFPSLAVLLNALSIIWLQYDRLQKVLNISIRLRLINIIIIIVAGLLALLFVGHTIADYLAGAD